MTLLLGLSFLNCQMDHQLLPDVLFDSLHLTMSPGAVLLSPLTNWSPPRAPMHVKALVPEASGPSVPGRN